MATYSGRATGFPTTQTSILRRVFSFPAVLAALLAVSVFAIARNGLSDPDIWWHLRNVQYLLTQHRLPSADVYSWTVYGQPWIDHEWLAEIPYYLAWRAFGLVGIKVLSLLILEVIFGGVFYLCWRSSRNVKASTIACYLAILLGSVSFGPRTLLFGFLYLVSLLLILENFRAGAEAPLWLLPLLFCFWINTHGSWAIGIIVLGIFLGGGLIGGSWQKIEAAPWSAKQLRQLLAVMMASIAALFVNPYGYQLVLYPLDMAFRQKLNIQHVAEWSSVDFHDTRGKIALVLLLTLLLGALLSARRWRPYEVGFALFGICTGLTYVRFLFVAGILTAPLITAFFNFLPRYKPEIDRPAINAALIAAAFAFIFWGLPKNQGLLASINREYPAEALPQIASFGPSDHILNYYLWGGYLGWEQPNFRDFIDSRVDIFEYSGVLKDYLNLLDLRKPDAILDKYSVRYVLFPPSEPLSYVLERDPAWTVRFRGNVSMLFERAQSGRSAAADSSEHVHP